MTVSTLDPITALIIVDLQKGVVAAPTAHPLDEVVANAASLAREFRSRRLTVVLVTVDGGAPGRTEGPSRASGSFPDGFTELLPELDRQPSDHTVMKRTWGSFTNTDLDDYLKGLGVSQVVIAGVATSAGVESTARHAHELGYNVTLALDAMTDRIAEAHDNSIGRVFPRIGETGTTSQIISLLS